MSVYMRYFEVKKILNASIKASSFTNIIILLFLLLDAKWTDCWGIRQRSYKYV